MKVVREGDGGHQAATGVVRNSGGWGEDVDAVKGAINSARGAEENPGNLPVLARK